MQSSEFRRSRAQERQPIAKQPGRRRSSRRKLYRRALRKLGTLLLNLLGPPILYLLGKSWRVTRRGFDHYQQLEDGEHAFLAAVWHGRTLTFAPLHKHRGLNILVSPSGDGLMVGGLLRKLGYGVIWGSSNTRGAGALMEIRSRLSTGDSVVIMLDGPRGPRHSTHTGVAWLARETGLPILAAAVSCDRGWHLRSWDRLLIPKIGARLIITYAEPIHVAANTSKEGLSEVAERIGARIMQDEEEGFRILGVEQDW